MFVSFTAIDEMGSPVMRSEPFVFRPVDPIVDDRTHNQEHREKGYERQYGSPADPVLRACLALTD